MQTPRQSRSQSGFTLAEVLVSVAVFAVIFIAALAIYDRSNKEFKTGVERSEMQQNTRVAFEKLVAEVRQAGFDYDRDGFPVSAGAAVWVKSRSYGSGNVVSPTVANGYTYTCITAGTSGGTEPAWSTTLGGTTVDGTARWRTDAGINQYQQPDEQIEYAHQRAITFRANLDYETDSANENGREAALQRAEFPVVTTANDEIVTYALRSDRGPNPDRVQFYADVPDRRSFPGGRSENLVTIDNLDLCTSGVCAGAPYTLYRFTVKPGAGTVDEAAIATNIRDFELTYYADTIGVDTPLAFTPAVSNAAGSAGGGQYIPTLPSSGAEARGRRAEVKSIRVRLTGMAMTPTYGYINPEEVERYTAASLPPATSPAYHHRTYSLTSLVVPRNLGRMGVRELQESPPGEPALTSVCSGWCGVVRVTWQAPPLTGETGDVDQYIVVYDTVTPPVRFQKAVGPVVQAYIDGLDPTQRYFFTVAAVNSFGTTIAKTAAGAVETLPTGSTGLLVRNETTPMPPSGLVATGSVSGTAVPNKVTLNWSNPTASTSPGAGAATCISIAGGSSTEAAPFVGGELRTYEVLRSEDPDFDPTDPSQYTLVSPNTPNRLTVGASTSSFEDNTAVACVRYYYRLRTVERCDGVAGATAPPSRAVSTYFPAAGDPGILGVASATSKPLTPAALILPPPPNPQSSCGVDCTIYLQWPKVVLNEDGQTIAVRDYVITRKQMKGTTVIRTDSIPVRDTTPGVGQYATFSGNPYYTDTGIPSVDTADGVEYRYVYTVRAVLSCSPDLESGETGEVKFPCPFTGTGITVGATGMTDGDGTTISNAWVTSPSGASTIEVTGTGITTVQLLLSSLSDSSVLDMGTASGPYVFDVSGVDVGELYRAYVIVKDTDGCQEIAVRYVEGGTPTGCCLVAYADDTTIMSFTAGTSFVDVTMRSLCANDLTIQPSGIFIQWDPLRTPVGTKLIGVDFPGETGGRVTRTVSDATGALTISLPAGARNPIRAGEPQKVTLVFDRSIPASVLGIPVTGFCVTYQRAGVDISNQNCKIVPEPPAPNSCLP